MRLRLRAGLRSKVSGLGKQVAGLSCQVSGRPWTAAILEFLAETLNLGFFLGPET